MEAIILAGGEGKRLRSLVWDRPKPMADVNGRPFLEYLLDALIEQGCEHFILSTCYKKEVIRSHFGNVYKSVKISYSEDCRPLGTGGSLLRAHKYLFTKSPFLIVNGDSFFDIDLTAFKNFFEENMSDFSIALFTANESNRYGLVRLDDNGNVTTASERKASVGDLASGGYFIARYNVVSLFEHDLTSFSLEGEFLPVVQKNGCKITGLHFNSHFIDIGLPGDLLNFSASRKLQRTNY